MSMQGAGTADQESSELVAWTAQGTGQRVKARELSSFLG